MSDLVVSAETTPSAAFIDLTPEKQVDAAGKIATLLCDVIEKQKLYTDLRGKKYVNVEGWQTLGSFLRVLPKERQVTRHNDGTFEAHVDLIDRHGQVVGSGSAICGADESMWMKRPEYARRSMAITRATGKAYRIAFSWIMNMAGYEPTPLEEMDHVEPTLYEGTAKQKQALAAICKNKHAIEEPEIMKEIHTYLIKENAPFLSIETEINKYVKERTL